MSFANRLCLDFVNANPTSFADLVSWGRAAGALDGAEAEYVMQRWGDGAEAEAALRTALGLRAHLRTIAERLVLGNRRVPPDALEAINNALRSRPGFLQIEPDGTDWAERWKVPLRKPDDVLWRIARSAASLLSSDDLSLVKRCENASCGMFFYDTTKNHAKRFCRMETCGVRARAAAYYRRRTEG